MLTSGSFLGSGLGFSLEVTQLLSCLAKIDSERLAIAVSASPMRASGICTLIAAKVALGSKHDLVTVGIEITGMDYNLLEDTIA